jgi:Periplasmic copper-binding protein (NosD)
MNRRIPSSIPIGALTSLLFISLSVPAAAATLCVNKGGTGGCYASIAAAVAAASPNDTIRVAQGKYKEDVVIGKPLSLIGAHLQNTIIDAIGLSNGVYIDGLDNPGLSNVVVTGFTVENANFEGILVTNASAVTVWGNRAIKNDLALNISDGTCPGLPSFETEEGFDCGEGIHITGVDHSTIANNISENNSGGILISDDTGETHDNVISRNVSENNPFDCGIVLASHPAYNGSAPFGIVRNTITRNQSIHNGYEVGGAGAGVGIFSGVTGGVVSANVISYNQLSDNGLPGVTFHSHQPGDTLTDNVILGNRISGNGPDTEDAATPGPTGINLFGVSAITGTVISGNKISNEAYQVVVNTPAEVDLHLNDFGSKTVGIDNIGGGTANAVENYWGCAGGPGANGCATSMGPNILVAPWLTTPF